MEGKHDMARHTRETLSIEIIVESYPKLATNENNPSYN